MCVCVYFFIEISIKLICLPSYAEDHVSPFGHPETQGPQDSSNCLLLKYITSGSVCRQGYTIFIYLGDPSGLELSDVYCVNVILYQAKCLGKDWTKTCCTFVYTSVGLSECRIPTPCVGP